MVTHRTITPGRARKIRLGITLGTLIAGLLIAGHVETARLLALKAKANPKVGRLAMYALHATVGKSVSIVDLDAEAIELGLLDPDSVTE